jgi:uncharacterized protein
MDLLYQFHQNMRNQVKPGFTRYLMSKIDWNQRMIAIKGPRGSGKTTLMLQYIRYQLPKNAHVLYTSMDHYWYYTHNLVETVEMFVNEGGTHLFIDEVHKYPHWSREIKNIYDAFPQLKIVFSSSSALDINKGEADLSRRVITHELAGLSFREFLQLHGLTNLPILSFEEISHKHVEISRQLTDTINILPHFRNYLQYGYLPIFMEGKPIDVPIKLSQVINAVVDTDLNIIHDLSPGTTFKLKKLLGVLAESAPFKPNIAALARKLDVSRDSIYAWFTHLEHTRLLNLLHAEGKGISLLQKPEKVYLENTNLSFALKSNPDKGTIRETFLLNQLRNVGLNPKLPSAGDLVVDDVYIEIGGSQKKNVQVNKYNQYIIAADDILVGYGHKIPLWLFGFMY